MALDFTPYYRLRKPKVSDSVDQTDFDRFFTGNPDIIDAELHRLSEALSGLGNGANAEEISTLRNAFDNLRTYVNGFADRIAALETNSGSGSESADLSALNGAVASIQQTLGGYGTRLTVLEQGGIPTATLEAIHDALSDIRRTLSGYGGRIDALENADHTVNLAPLEGRVGALEGILPDVLPVANSLTGRVSELESAYTVHNGFSGRLDALETLLGTLSGRMNSLSSAINELEDVSGIADTSALVERISALGQRISSDLTLLSNRIATLENSAFTDLREGPDGYWYAYNKSGVQVDGPLRMGYLNGGRTWADIFGVTEIPEPASEPSPAPRTWAQIFGITV